MQFNKIYAPTTISISDLKKNPMSVTETGSAVAVLNNNKTVFYAVPADLWETAMRQLKKFSE
jgi:PHD/YefM family antitoxin component YafN of YafNO toxin-antitoxin module